MNRNSAISLVIGALSAITAAGAVAKGRPRPPSEFAELGIIVEQNATDGDTEVVISGIAGDDGLALLSIRSPDGRIVATLIAPDRATLGQREFHFESPEPPGEAVLAGYPEGNYVFNGVTFAGERFRGAAELSHLLPAATTILFPLAESEISAAGLTIQWSAVPGIREYRLEFENESLDPEQVLTVNLSPDVTSFEVPSSLLVPDSDYQVGIQTVGENGNVVAVEVTFTTAE